ncbi:MAG: hypothetical protein Q8K99_11015 [Actinomycetota bacterium]|nr:hypothetical protein [Actinomycetota bacterium]
MVILYGLAACTLLVTGASTYVVLRLSGWNVYSTKVMIMCALAMATGLSATAGILFRAASPNSALALTLGTMVFIGPVVGLLGILVLFVAFRHALWIAYSNDRQLPRGLDRREIEQWAAAKGLRSRGE